MNADIREVDVPGYAIRAKVQTIDGGSRWQYWLYETDRPGGAAHVLAFAFGEFTLDQHHTITHETAAKVATTLETS